jgi:hypothetical protein
LGDKKEKKSESLEQSLFKAADKLRKNTKDTKDTK